ncbi:hypothetical protein PIB30_045969 [Stylosanthes scabra]|uniref:Uncharacterized protein n=1 Tax=Stylosanthes scabra TaxID=79078 RepID=A0ABU6SGH5_9FABA|nr:hypothetical protein [Stylosanthes scabra]
MGNTEKLMNQIMELKFTSKSLQRQARKCEKEEKSEKLKVADDYGLEVSVGLPQPAAHAVPAKETEKVDEDDLTRRLAELKARG